jgi:hypothetical protein
MEIHALCFAGFLIALSTFVVLFRHYEDRHRFVLIRAESLSSALLWGRKLHRACLAINGDVPADGPTINFCR